MSDPIKILVLDDDIDLAESLADIFEAEGHDVTLVHDGPSAIAAFQDEDFDVGFFDVKMPGMNGVESFLEIKKMRPDAKVFMMTGYSVEQLLEQALENGALGILRKPFDIEDIIGTLETIKNGLIVVADDDREFTASIAPLLIEEGYRVAVVNNGRDALNTVLSSNANLLILDLNLPVLSGFEVYMELKAKGREIPTIIVTGHGPECSSDIDKLQQFSVTGVLHKPFNPNDLFQAISGCG